MVHAKNNKTMSTFVKVMQKKTVASFFPDTVYILSIGLVSRTITGAACVALLSRP